MSFLLRYAILVAITLVVTIGVGGGFANSQNFAFVWSLTLIYAAVPIAIIVAIFMGFEYLTGTIGTYIISAIGLAPIGLVIFAGGRGDSSYIATLIFCGLGWSAAWLLTAQFFSEA